VHTYTHTHAYIHTYAYTHIYAHIQSITVNGAQQLFTAANKAGSNIVITLRNVGSRYGINFDTVTASFGGSSVTTTFIPIGVDARVTLKSPLISLQQPQTSTTAAVVMTLVRNSATVMQITTDKDGASVSLEFRDLSSPAIVAISPSQAPTRGGAIMVLGVTGIPAILTNTVRCVFAGSISARVYGVVSLSDWETQQGKFQALVDLPDVSSFMSGISAAMSADHFAAVKTTRDTALLSLDESVVGQKAAVAIVQVCL
jgi:hypothetical protein